MRISEVRKAYLQNEEAYKKWAEVWNLFNQRRKDRYYYRKGVNRERRRALAEWVLRDFPNASWRDVQSQTGGCREILWEFGLWESPHDNYWVEDCDLHYVYSRLRANPNDIFTAIENPKEWAKKNFMPSRFVKMYIPRILSDIGNGVI